MEQQLDQLSKAVKLAEAQAMGLLKSHVKQYTRSDGTVVAEHEDSRRKADEAHNKAMQAYAATRTARTWMDHKKAAQLHYEAAAAQDEAGNDEKYDAHIDQAETHADMAKKLK